VRVVSGLIEHVAFSTMLLEGRRGCLLKTTDGEYKPVVKGEGDLQTEFLSYFRWGKEFFVLGHHVADIDNAFLKPRTIKNRFFVD